MDFVGKDNNFLVIGINYDVLLWQIQALPGPNFKMQMITKVTQHTFILDIKVLGNTIYVGDMVRGMSVFSYKEGSTLPHLMNTAAGQPKISLCSKIPFCQWIMNVLPLNEAQCLTFDQHRNVIVYERILKATNDLAKRKIEPVAGIKWDERITKAVIGQFSANDTQSDD